MTKVSRFAVMGLISCLTISQGALAQTRAQTQAAKPHKRAMLQKSSGKLAAYQAPRSQSERMSSDSYDGGESVTQKPAKQKSLLGFAKTIFHPIPDSGKFLFEAGLTGTSTESKINGKVQTTYSSTKLNYKNTSTSRGSSLALKGTYGVTDSIYVGALANYGTSSGESKSEIESLVTKSESKSTAKGFEEPSLLGGFHVLNGNTRFLSEVELEIPTGNRSSKTNRTSYGTENESDMKDGGGSITPRLITITDLRTLKLIGQLSYSIQGERKTDRSGSDIATPTTETLKGGNQLSLMAATELPQLVNLTLGLGYNRSEGTTSSISNETSEASEIAMGFASAGIPMGDQSLLIPRIVYATPIKKSVGDSTIDSMDVVFLQLNTAIMF